ncbi:hypothetical protein ELI_1780 [Eubacterium callanderi]|uniref:Uncharacterized protein n=1 Tax=Eubacterium callanderi TaxID=53442 RepID=E3GDG1_9FIRM|nr:hypothetical protein ELI_1780 [Eubacterium callanderi]
MRWSYIDKIKLKIMIMKINNGLNGVQPMKLSARINGF